MHKPGDRQVVIIIIGFLFLYAAVLITGVAMHQLLLHVAVMNTIAGSLIISYWVWDKLRPLQRMTEQREIIVLSIEGLFAAVSLYAVITNGLSYWLTVVQYIIFTLHAVLLLLFLVFMLTFKIKKLF
ncbi:MAG TPA: hypothetical protein VK645_17745 [Chitinophagaceae bacterium]|nr:hypothetical protein [Chitinophagaceae bacterium]